MIPSERFVSVDAVPIVGIHFVAPYFRLIQPFSVDVRRVASVILLLFAALLISIIVSGMVHAGTWTKHFQHGTGSRSAFFRSVVTQHRRKRFLQRFYINRFTCRCGGACRICGRKIDGHWGDYIVFYEIGVDSFSVGA